MKRFVPVAIILILMGIAYYFRLDMYLSLDQIKAHRIALSSFVLAHPYLAPIAYMAAYFAVTVLSIPGAIFLTLLGGFLFPQPFSTIYVVIGATLGAVILFLIAKTALGEPLRKKAGPFIQKMEKGFQENAASYMLFLRFVPLFPFWLVNLAPAFFGVPLWTFIWTTFVGIIPGVFVFTQIGAGLGSILDSSEKLTLSSALTTDVKIALIALGIFALLPILIKKIWNKNHPGAA